MILGGRSSWTRTSSNCRKYPKCYSALGGSWLWSHYYQRLWPWGSQNGCVSFPVKQSTEALSTYQAVCPSTPTPRPSPDPGGQRASHQCLSVFMTLRLPIQIQHRAGKRFAWPSYLCAAFNPLALQELYANPTCDSPPSQISLTLKHTP